ELQDTACALPVDGPQAVGAGVAAANDDDVLVRGRDELIVGDLISLTAAILCCQVFHGEMDALQLTAWNGQIARNGGPAGENDGVELAAQLLDRHVHPDVAARAK